MGLKWYCVASCCLLVFLWVCMFWVEIFRLSNGIVIWNKLSCVWKRWLRLEVIRFRCWCRLLVMGKYLWLIFLLIICLNCWWNLGLKLLMIKFFWCCSDYCYCGRCWMLISVWYCNFSFKVCKYWFILDLELVECVFFNIMC